MVHFECVSTQTKKSEYQYKNNNKWLKEKFALLVFHRNVSISLMLEKSLDEVGIRNGQVYISWNSCDTLSLKKKYIFK